MVTIVSGMIETTRGPVAIEDLKAGDLAIDRGHRAFPIGKIEAAEVSEVLSFERSPAELGVDSVLLTTFGPRTAGTREDVKKLKPGIFRMTDSNGHMQKDRWEVKEGARKAFAVYGSQPLQNIFVNGYNVRC